MNGLQKSSARCSQLSAILQSGDCPIRGCILFLHSLFMLNFVFLVLLCHLPVQVQRHLEPPLAFSEQTTHTNQPRFFPLKVDVRTTDGSQSKLSLPRSQICHKCMRQAPRARCMHQPSTGKSYFSNYNRYPTKVSNSTAILQRNDGLIYGANRSGHQCPAAPLPAYLDGHVDSSTVCPQFLSVPFLISRRGSC